MSNPSGNLAVLSRRKPGNTTLPGSESFLDLTLALQTTLDLPVLLELFSRHLRSSVPHDGFAFRNSRLGIELTADATGRHSCVYTLMLKEEVLGEWRVIRKRKFSEAELECIEAYLCRLLYPLRNALKYRQALYFAETDPLTGAGNRSALLAFLYRESELSMRYGVPLSLIFLDIDRFKAINDACGHDAGDAVLRGVADTLQQLVRTCDAVFRYGGEEFVIVLPNTSELGALRLAERLRRSLELRGYDHAGTRLQITASLGVATRAPSESHESLLRRADQAMYAAKHGGRNRVVAAAEAPFPED